MSNTGRPPDPERYILDHFDEALRKEYLRVYVQPVIRTLSGQVCGMEALSRWHDPEYGVLQPGLFIPVLENHRLIHRLDAYVVERICRKLHSTPRGMSVPISVNLSRLDYELCDIFRIVENAVQTHRIPRSSLCIEITESALARNEALLRSYIRRFRDAGYPVWMDDFGSGYSSLNVLKDYEFDELKIDMRFLSDFHTRSKRILASIVHMAKQIGIQTLAEGVETREHYDFLRNIGCEKLQGFYFGRPVPMDEIDGQVMRNGLQWENPAERGYYDEVGRINVLSATPFETSTSSQDVTTGRELNSTPLAIIEMRGNQARPLFHNLAFESMATEIGWLELLDTSSPRPLDSFPRHLSGLLEETRSIGTGKNFSVFNDEYYAFETRRLARHGDTCTLLMSVMNLSRTKELERLNQLDEGLRSLYAMYDQVCLIDLYDMTIESLYTGAAEDWRDKPSRIETYVKKMSSERIFQDDRERFVRFIRPGDLEDRIRESGTECLSSHLRVLAFHGKYVWKCFLLVRIRADRYYLLIRDSGGEVREFQDAYMGISNGSDRDGLSAGMLWANVTSRVPMKFFWKDRNRRFAGASRSFLEFYGFESVNEILGKTDEEVGWHLHPDVYRNAEESVIREGIVSREVLGNCIVQGESRNITASKMPLYNQEGEIVGLIGYFSEVNEMGTDGQKMARVRTDTLTGLLNTRGLYEDLFGYIDEYDRRRQDFARIEVGIEDFASINRTYGYDFGDKVIQTVGTELLSCCKSTATVGRVMGCCFLVFMQMTSQSEVDGLMEEIHRIPERIRMVDNIPVNIFLSAGYALYSETESRENQEIHARLRRITDDLEHVSGDALRENAGRIFQLYDNLPMAYAVYDVRRMGDREDAVILYVNQEFCEMTGMKTEQLVGSRVSRLFPEAGNEWMGLARRAAFEEEKITTKLTIPEARRDFQVTIHPVVGPGLCAFTYQPVYREAEPDAEDSPETPQS